MSLVEIIKKHQKEIANDNILIEYNLFFANVVKQDCKFVLDDSTEIKELDNKLFIYADTLWINTIIEIKEISHLFKKNLNIEPSDIASLAENETIDGVVALVVLEDGKVESYKSFIKKRELDKIKSLYWD